MPSGLKPGVSVEKLSYAQCMAGWDRKMGRVSYFTLLIISYTGTEEQGYVHSALDNTCNGWRK